MKKEKTEFQKRKSTMRKLENKLEKEKRIGRRNENPTR